MKIQKGTPYTQTLITNIITDLQKKGPLKNEVDYWIQKQGTKDYAEFSTTETKEVMRNISQIRLKKIYAVISCTIFQSPASSTFNLVSRRPLVLAPTKSSAFH